MMTGEMNNMRYTFCFFTVICLTFLTGCWDKNELNEVAVVMGVGIDKIEEEYQITAQVIKPPAGEGEGGGSELPTWSLSAKGNTVLGAIRNLNRMSPRRLYWAHLQVIIFGEELAREGVAPVITWFERDSDSRAGSYLLVTQGTAEDLLNNKVELENVPAKSMAELLKGSTLRQINTMETQLRDFMIAFSTPGIDPVLDVINPKEIRGKVETYELSGVAVFKNDKLKGFVTGPELTGTEILDNKLNFSIIEGKCPGNKDEFFTFQITGFKSNTLPELKGEKIIVNVDITLEGNLLDQTCRTDLLQPDHIKSVEQEITNYLKEIVENEFRTAKEMDSDIFGIGRDVWRFNPEFREKLTGSHAYLNNVEFDFQVKSNVRRSGLIIEPTPIKLKE